MKHIFKWRCPECNLGLDVIPKSGECPNPFCLYRKGKPRSRLE